MSSESEEWERDERRRKDDMKRVMEHWRELQGQEQGPPPPPQEAKESAIVVEEEEEEEEEETEQYLNYMDKCTIGGKTSALLRKLSGRFNKQERGYITQFGLDCYELGKYRERVERES